MMLGVCSIWLSISVCKAQPNSGPFPIGGGGSSGSQGSNGFNFVTITANQLTTNSFYIFGTSGGNVTGTYTWVPATSSYTNGNGGYAYSNSTTAGNWILSNSISGLWDDASPPTLFPFDVNNFPYSFTLGDGTINWANGGQLVGQWGTNNASSITVNSITNQNPLYALGTNITVVFGINNSVQNPVFPGLPSFVAGHNNFDIGFGSFITGEGIRNFGESTFTGASGDVYIGPNQAHSFSLGGENGEITMPNGVGGFLATQNCTNRANTYATLIDSGTSTIDFGASTATIINGSASRIGTFGLAGNFLLVIGDHNTNLSLLDGNIIGDHDYITNATHANIFGVNCMVSNANSSTVIGYGLTNTTTGTFQVGTTNAYITYSGTSNVFIGVGVFNGGIQSRATNDVSSLFTTTGVTNSSTNIWQLIGITGVTGNLKCVGGQTYSLGTITIPSTFILQVGDAITFASGAAKAGIKPL